MSADLEPNNRVSMPNINTYISAYKYLSDYYEYRKNLDSKFSYELWSVELGFKSKSSVNMICRGQKIISDSLIQSFSDKVGLNPAQKDYFYLLANYQNAKKPVLKRAYLDKIIEQVDNSVNTTDLKNHIQFLSSPALPILQLLISFKDFKATEAKIKEITGIKSKKLNEHFQVLEKLGLAQKVCVETEKDPVWVSNIKYFKISNKVQNEASNMFHQATTKEALEILNLKEDMRKFKSIFFSMNKENYADLSQDFDDFFAKIKFKYGNDFLLDKQLFKVNLQVYPVTKKLNK